MASYMLRKVPEGIIPRAKAQARESGTTLDAVLIGFLSAYAEKGIRNGYTGAAGGLARAAALTPEERSAIAKKGAEARWRRP